MVATLANKFDFRISLEGRNKSKSPPSKERPPTVQKKQEGNQRLQPRKTISTNIIDLIPTGLRQNATPSFLKQATLIGGEESVIELLEKENIYT